MEVLVGHLHLGERIRATGQREEDVLAAPHHALGHARGAAGVDDDLVVAGPLGEVTLGGTGGDDVVEHCGLELHLIGAAVVVDDDERLEERELIEHGGHSRAELLAVHQALQVGVVEEVAELLFDVPIVDVHGHGPDLQHRQ